MGVGLLWGLLAPLRAAVSPGRFYGQLRDLLDRYGIYVSGVVFFGAWIISSFISFILIFSIEFIRSITSLDIIGVALSPARALVYSLLFPVIPTIIDSLLIILILVFFDKERPLWAVFPIRASSLLPYTLRVVLLEIQGNLSLKTLASATMSPTGLLLLILGAILTIKGLRKTMGVPLVGATIAGIAPLAYKIILGIT